MKIKAPNTNKYHLSFTMKRKHVKMTFYGQFQMSMKFSAGKCPDIFPLSWGLWLDDLLVEELGCQDLISLG